MPHVHGFAAPARLGRRYAYDGEVSVNGWAMKGACKEDRERVWLGETLRVYWHTYTARKHTQHKDTDRYARTSHTIHPITH
jgi:hypothetical protein